LFQDQWGRFLDFAELDIFRTVAAEGSVTRAAQRLQRVQSNVTTRLRQLEAELGTPLFLRDGKRMVLTAEGETFLGYANRLLALEQEARGAISPGRPAGRLRLGSMESTAASRLPGPLARFHARWPAVALELTMGPSQRLVDAVQGHALDCALIALPKNGAPEPGLAAISVFTEELLLVLPAGHPPPEGPADIAVESLAALEPGCTYRRMAEDWLAPRTATRPPLRLLQLGSYHAILACVAAGTSIGVVPRSVLELQKAPLAIRSHVLGPVDTWLVRRDGYRSAAFDALAATLLGQEPEGGADAALPPGPALL
jgi:DNA-binding transcriptional LysR family regulator